MFLQYFKIKRNNYKNQTLSIYQEIVKHSNYFIKNSLYDKDYNFDEFSAIDYFDIALENIIKLAKQTKKPTIIFGSHYIAKPIFDKFGFYN